MLNTEDEARLGRMVSEAEGIGLEPDVIWAVNQLRMANETVKKLDEACKSLANAVAFWRSVLKQTL